MSSLAFALASLAQWWHGFHSAHHLSTWRDPDGRINKLACGTCGRVFWVRES